MSTHHAHTTSTGLSSMVISWGCSLLGTIVASLHDLPAAAVIGAGGGIIASLITYAGMVDARERRRLSREVDDLRKAGQERDRKLAADEVELSRLRALALPNERG